MLHPSSPEDPVFDLRLVARLSVLILMLSTAACGGSKNSAADPQPSPAKAAMKRVRLRHLRFSTDKEKLQWERAIQAVWHTPLGEMYAEYLFSPTEDHADLPLWARMMTERLYREVKFLTIRLAALQVMNDDLYVREQMTADVNDRITILQGHIDQERIHLDQSANEAFIPQVTAAFLVAVPFGSSVVRNRIVDAGRKAMRMAPLQRLPARGGHPLMILGRQAWAVGNAAGLIWSFFALVEWFSKDWYYTSHFRPKDEVMLLSLDDLVTTLNLVSSGKTHMQIPLVKPKPRPSSTP